MKYKNLFIRLAIVMVAVTSIMSCKKDSSDAADQRYGYLQIFLMKPQPNTRVTELNYLSDACKIRLSMLSEDGSRVSQTLNVTPYTNPVAEYGSQSEKCQMLAGKYKVTSYELFDNMDRSLLVQEFDTQDVSYIDVIPGGLSLHKIAVSAVGRGTLKFRLVKDNARPVTRTGGVKTYPFHMITYVDVTVKCLDNNVVTNIDSLKVAYKNILAENDANHFTAVSESDSLVRLPAGRYTVTKYKTYFGRSYVNVENLVEVNENVAPNEFVVVDNTTIIADVPVTLEETAEYIKDAYALKKIWEALDGPNWSYRGNSYAKGVNWVFEGRDIDMWLAQPGVQLHSNGRIAVINFGGFGAKGKMPAEIGQLTELRQLYLGTHNDDLAFPIPNISSKVVSESQMRQRDKDLIKSFSETYISNGHVLESFSPELQEGFEIMKASVNGVPFKKSAHPIRRLTNPTVSDYLTYITELPAEMGQLVKLESLYIAFSPLTDLPMEMRNCKLLSTVELYGCPAMEHIPPVMAEMSGLSVLVFVSNKNVSAENLYSDLQNLNEKASDLTLFPKGNFLQQIFVPEQKLTRVPDLRKLKNLHLLNINSCGVESFDAPFGKDILFVQLNADNNKISSLPVDESGVFVGLHNDLESLSFMNNQFTEFPNIFSAKSIFTLPSVNFAGNKITKFQGEDDGTWKGINVNVLGLGFNQFEKFPSALYNMDKEKCSSISYLQLQGNKIDEIPEDALKGLHTNRLVTLDISVNRLTKLPPSFNAVTFPYLYGLDMSYNRFTSIQTQPLNSATLTVYLFRGQRDEKGNRCMREWLTGIGQHTGLRALYLGSNDIRLVNDNNLSYMIFNLEIADNPNIVIDVSSLCPYITAGYFRLGYDRTQDIRGCEALKINK